MDADPMVMAPEPVAFVNYLAQVGLEKYLDDHHVYTEGAQMPSCYQKACCFVANEEEFNAVVNEWVREVEAEDPGALTRPVADTTHCAPLSPISSWPPH